MNPITPEPSADPQTDPAEAALPPRPPATPAWGVLETLARNSAGWLASLALHLSVVLLLGLWYAPEIPKLAANLLASRMGPEEEFDSFEEILPTEVELDLKLEEPDSMQPLTDNVADMVNLSSDAEVSGPAPLMDFSNTGAAVVQMELGDGLGGPEGETGLSGRGRMARNALVRRGGGNTASEAAVGLALQWLAEHQGPRGAWDLRHQSKSCNGRCDNPGNLASADRAATALALLPFLGAGQTHKQGRYKQVVQRGLNALVNMGSPQPRGASWLDPGGPGMYSHGLATIALCEALGMTGDSNLIVPAQNAIDFIIDAQNPEDGGWRYQPRDRGDTSVVGWQVMALKSANLAGLSVPASTIRGAEKFLNSVQTDAGYNYMAEDLPDYRRTTTAVGLLCRMYLGWRQDDPRLGPGVLRLAKEGPSPNDMYFNYYGAQVMFQYTSGRGPLWLVWNRKMRDLLISEQETRGHARGSWFLEGDTNNAQAGRLYVTSLATLTLEVYYRYLPIYSQKAFEVEGME